MIRSLIVLAMLVVAPAFTQAADRAPAAGGNREQGAQGSAGSGSDGAAVQHGAQPNAGEVRPGNPDGDAPSASAGTVVKRDAGRGIFGWPVNAVLLIGGAIIVILVVEVLFPPRRRARDKTRGRP